MYALQIRPLEVRSVRAEIGDLALDHLRWLAPIVHVHPDEVAILLGFFDHAVTEFLDMRPAANVAV